MEYTKRRRTIKPEISSLQATYPNDLQLYMTPPTGDIRLSEFEELALERLKVLRIIESVSIRSEIKTVDERKNAIIADLKKEGLHYFAKLIKAPGCASVTEAELQGRRRDHVSHFILRLAYCRNEDLKKWFIGREVELFKLRFTSLNADGIKHFLQINNLNYVPIPDEEKKEIEENLYQSTMNFSPVQVDNMDFYKVPFPEVTDLIKNRKVFVKAGFAYVPSVEFVSVFVNMFRMNLAVALAYTLRKLPSLDDDDRVNSLLRSLHTIYTGKSYAVCDSAEVPIENLDMLSETSYPLCMRTLHESLRSLHHLKHGGRMQYGLFIKGIGVTLEDAMRFWREEFTQKMDLEVFEKKHAYNIRHNYGKEGKRTNYTPYSCLKIIQGSVGPGDFHGCPFKHMDNNVLKQKILSYGVPAAAVQDIGEWAKNGHYQVACSKYFEATHKAPPDNAIVHPNGYFNDSQKILSVAKNPTGLADNSSQANRTKPSQAEPKLNKNDDDMDAALSQLEFPMEI